MELSEKVLSCLHDRLNTSNTNSLLLALKQSNALIAGRFVLGAITNNLYDSYIHKYYEYVY